MDLQDDYATSQTVTSPVSPRIPRRSRTKVLEVVPDMPSSMRLVTFSG
jgi:hypothetical protein